MRDGWCADCVSLLIKSGAEINFPVGYDAAALLHVTRHTSHVTVQAKGCIGWTPLHELMASGAATCDA